MRTLLASLIALSLLGAAPVAAQAQEPAAVSGTQQADLTGRRRELETLDARRADLATRRRALEAELDELAADIARRKALKADSAALFTDPELDRRLKRSRELSARIDTLLREEDRTADRLRQLARSLLSAFDARLDEARAALEAAAGPDRDAALTALATLEAERRAVQSGLDRLSPDGAVTELPVASPVADDPEDLRAQADLLRDTQDRLARRLGELDRRVEELRDQRALEADMEGFLSETAFMDERDRSTGLFGPRRSLTAEADESTELQTGADDRASPPAAEYDSGAVSGGSDGLAGDPTNEGVPAEPVPSDPAPSAPAPDTIDAGALFRFERITTRADASAALEELLRLEPGDSLEELEARRAELESLIGRLGARADGLEARADRVERR